MAVYQKSIPLILSNIEDWNDPVKIKDIRTKIQKSIIDDIDTLRDYIGCDTIRTGADGKKIKIATFFERHDSYMVSSTPIVIKMLKSNPKVGLDLATKVMDGYLMKGDAPDDVATGLNIIAPRVYEWCEGDQIIYHINRFYNNDPIGLEYYEKLIKAKINEANIFKELKFQGRISDEKFNDLIDRGVISVARELTLKRYLKALKFRLSVSKAQIEREISSIGEKGQTYNFEQKYLKYKAKYFTLKQTMASQ